MPDIRNLIAKVQAMTSSSKGELGIVFLVLLGLTIGLIYNNFFRYEEEDISAKELSLMLDALADEKAASFHGTELISSEDEPTNEKASTNDVTKTSEDSPELININTASLTTLMKLSGVGKATAKKIIIYRDQNKFSSLEDIMKVKGIGPAKFKKIKSFIKVN